MSNPVFKIADDTPTTTLTIDEAANKVAALQEAKSKLEKEIRALKAPIRSYMEGKGLAKYETDKGVKVALFDTNRTDADKAVASEILTPEQYSAIFKVKTVSNLKIK